MTPQLIDVSLTVGGLSLYTPIPMAVTDPVDVTVWPAARESANANESPRISPMVIIVPMDSCRCGIVPTERRIQ